MQDAQDVDISLSVSPEENHMLVAWTGQQPWSQIISILPKDRCSGQSREYLIKLGQIEDSLIFTPMISV